MILLPEKQIKKCKMWNMYNRINMLLNKQEYSLKTRVSVFLSSAF